MKKAILALADGLIFEGQSFGAEGEATGEVVFNTSLTGYQEIFTDPSYKGQMVTMTYPHIGNYGANEEDMESSRVWAEGLIVREFCRHPSNWRATFSLEDLLAKQRIVGIEGIDTRALTKHIRDQGEQVGIISTLELDPQRLVQKASHTPGLEGQDLVRKVTSKEPHPWKNEKPRTRTDTLVRGKVVVYDFGIKRNILRILAETGCEVNVVPADYSAEKVLAMHPDGVLLSNGPGDPAALPYAVENIRRLIGKTPIFGICLGHQLLALALGASTYKLKFGHHGGNHPVMDLKTREVKITTQNHGFSVQFKDVPISEFRASRPDDVQNPRPETLFGPVEITHLSLNDQTVEGIRCLNVPAFSVQYHPESSPGPHDARYLFKQFTEMMAGP
jgi:carbamoyl-phosphate synthase small subunit